MKLVLCDEYKKKVEGNIHNKLLRLNIGSRYIFNNVLYDYCDKYKILESDLNNLMKFFENNNKITLNKINNYKKNYTRGILPTLIKICELCYYKGYYSTHYKNISVLYLRENVVVYTFNNINGI